MVVKRVTIELDDLPETGSTSTPPSLISNRKNLQARTPTTAIPEKQDDYIGQESTEKEKKGIRIPETIGRTPSDLVFAFINRPEFMATILTILAFLIC
jgi:hypothetical protein